MRRGNVRSLQDMTEPRHEVVDVDVRVTYGDAAVITIEIGQLRAVCPCAACRGKRERGEPVVPPPGGGLTVREALRIVDVELVGAWGMSIGWSDGHANGIYAWTTLRDWWDAGHDGPLVADPGP
jgi:DUF971 family protein